MPKKKKIPGKPGPKKESKLNQNVVKKLEHAFAIDASIDEACYYADISRQTFYNWKKSHPDLFDKFERLRQKPILAAREKVVRGINKDVDVAFRYLEKKRRKEFGNKLSVDGVVFNGEIDPKHQKVIDGLLDKMVPKDLDDDFEE